MKNQKLLTKICAAVLAVSCCAVTAPYTAVNAAKPADSEIQPMNIAISGQGVNLTKGLWGKVTCYGETRVMSGYTAGLTVELQKQNGSSWTTVKSWSAKGSTKAIVNEEYYADTGYTYRLKNTHRAYNSSGSVVETLYSYGY